MNGKNAQEVHSPSGFQFGFLEATSIFFSDLHLLKEF